MPSFFVVPFVVPIKDHLRVIDGVELVTIDNLSLQVGVERLDVGVVLRCADVGELLQDPLLFEVSPNNLGNELGAVVVADGHALRFVFQQHQRQHDQDITFADMAPKLIDQHLPAVDIDYRQQEHISAGSVDMHVFDVHRQVLKRPLRLQAPEPDKIPLERQWPDPGAKQQSGFLHEPVHFFVIDEPAQLPELGRHILVAVTAEFLTEDHVHLQNNDLVFHSFTLHGKGVGTRLDAFAAPGTFVIKAAGGQAGP